MRLHSAATFWQKLLLPSLLLSAFSFATVICFVNDLPPKWALPGVLVFVTAVSWYRLWPLKTVKADADGLLIGNFRREIRVPYADIQDVAMLDPGNPVAAVITLTHPSDFGQRIKFLPYHKFCRFKNHPAIRLLRERAGLAPL